MYFVAGTKERAARPEDVGKWCDIDYYDGLRDPRGYEDEKYDTRKGYGLTFWTDRLLTQTRSWIERYEIHTFLELGCAKGFVVQAMRMQGVAAWGLDISKYATSMCHPEMKPFVLKQDATDLSRWKDKYFDYIYSWDFLEHLDRDKVSKCLRECRRVCKGEMEHGITAFDKMYGSIAATFPDEPQDPTHVSCYTVDWWKAQISGIFSKKEVTKFEVGQTNAERRKLINLHINLREKNEKG